MRELSIVGGSKWLAKDDRSWMQTITLKIAPQPTLTDEQKK